MSYLQIGMAVLSVGSPCIDGLPSRRSVWPGYVMDSLLGIAMKFGIHFLIDFAYMYL